MNNAKLLSLPCALMVVVAVLFLGTSAAMAAPAFTCGSWNYVASPNSGSSDTLFSVAPITSSDVWAVGGYTSGSNPVQTLTENWNGSQWSIVSSPNIGSYPNVLVQASKVPKTNDVWAVGSYTVNNNQQTLTEYWNGSQWSIVPSPNPSSLGNILTSVVAITANNVWAAGETYNVNLGAYDTLILHWNGTTWKVVPSPSPNSFSSYLNGIVDLSANDIWAVGEYTSLNSDTNQTLTEHWNGTKWKIVASPNVNSNDHALNAAIVAGAKGVWAVGSYSDNSGTAQTLTLHWNGTKWKIVASPNSGSSDNALFGLTAVSSSDVWDVGSYIGSNGLDQALIEHWNGSQWSIVPGASIGANVSVLNAVARIPGSSSLWAVGQFSGSNNLTEFYC